MRLLLLGAVLSLGSRGAHAACVLNGARPTEALPTMVAARSSRSSPRPTALSCVSRSAAPRCRRSRGSVGPIGPGARTFKVVLTESEWDAVVADSGPTLTWVVTGRTSGA